MLHTRRGFVPRPIPRQHPAEEHRAVRANDSLQTGCGGKNQSPQSPNTPGPPVLLSLSDGHAIHMQRRAALA